VNELYDGELAEVNVPGISERLGEALGAAFEAQVEKEVRGDPLPKHVAVIMDGNRRFAWAAKLPAKAGHKKGREQLEKVLDWVLELGIEWFTIYALSSENRLSRTDEELDLLYRLYIDGLSDIADDPRIHENKVKVQCVGQLSELPDNVRKAIDIAREKTTGYDDFTFTVCLNYGGREEIVQAIRHLAERVSKGELEPEQIEQSTVAEQLYTAGMPDPDLIIRTSGEERISNFLLWQAAYSELYFTDVYWPMFTRREFLKAIRSYQRRQRRFGR
tara:strand:- start:280 stop:1101 length:822 start_codon:yes stop_codon:yes gene_type:complete